VSDEELTWSCTTPREVEIAVRASRLARGKALAPPRVRLGRAGAPRWSPWACNAVLGLLLFGACVVALSLGRSGVSFRELIELVLARLGLHQVSQAQLDAWRNIVFDLRLPRVLCAALVGASLSVSGASFQAVFRNPLVSPSLLGVQAGAAFGAALGMLCSADWWAIQLLAFGTGLVAVGLGVVIPSTFDRPSLVMLILGGVVTTALFSSLLSLVKCIADPLNVLPSIVYWLMGNLAMAERRQVLGFSVPLLAGMALLSCFGRALDAIAMGDDEARTLGVPVQPLRYAVIVVATLISALTVSLAGIIGWVGLIVPHVVRLVLGPNNRTLLPASVLAGGGFLVLADCVGRALLAIELPIGIVTELLGIPVFLVVLRYAKRGWTS
jgi:iron complex transport system permease protein